MPKVPGSGDGRTNQGVTTDSISLSKGPFLGRLPSVEAGIFQMDPQADFATFE